MANYYATARSNYFKVKDVQKFQEICEKFCLTFITDEENRVGFLVNGDGGLTSEIYDENTKQFIDADPLQEVSTILQEGEICVYQEVGAEKHRYLVGFSEAISHFGERITVSIDDIYEKIQDEFLRASPTQCQY